MTRLNRRLLPLLLACALVVAVGWPSAPRVTVAAPQYQLLTEPGSHLAPVLSLIHNAKHSIRLVIYLLTQRPVIAALSRAAHAGVVVRVLLEEHPYGGDSSALSAYSALRAAGVNVRWANEGAFRFTHEKALIVDGVTAGIFSFNLTYSGVYTNREFGIIDHTPQDATTLARIFDADWNRTLPRVSLGHLVVSPLNARSDLDHLIDGAHHTLDVYAEEVDDSSLELHLDAARKRGVRVRLITSSGSGGVDALRVGGISVAIMAHPFVHAKAFVADGTTFFVGSENISSTSLDRNREAGIILTDRGMASSIEHTFNGDWRTNTGGTTPFGSPPSPPPGPSSGPFSVRVSASPSSVRKGQELTIRVETRAGASCSIQVTYPDGYVSRASSLSGTRTASSAGTVFWSWHVGSTVTGTAHAAVTCLSGSASATGSVSFVITQ